jgi:hypothetical protein
MIARSGRSIVIKNVVFARLVHQLLVVDAPVWLLEEVIKWIRASVKLMEGGASFPGRRLPSLYAMEVSV